MEQRAAPQSPTTNGAVTSAPLSSAQRVARDRYLEDKVSTVTPHTLVVMLYDRLLKDCETARVAIGQNDLYEANHALQHGQDVLVELHSALDPTKWEHAAQLGSIYLYLINELTEANLKKDAKRVVRASAMIVPLRDAWSEAATLVSSGNANYDAPPANGAKIARTDAARKSPGVR